MSSIVSHVISVDGTPTDNLLLVIPSFSFTVNAINATILTYNPVISHGVDVTLYASASILNNAFQIFTDDIEIMQNNQTRNTLHDLRFRYVDQSGNYGSYANLFDTFANSVADTNPTNSTTYVPPRQSLLDPLATRKTMGDEYVSYISYALFNNTQGLDLLDNVLNVSDGLNAQADSVIINDKLYLLTIGGENGGNIYSGENQISDYSHPGQLILTQIETFRPERLQNLVPVDGSGNENWYKNFLIEGDTISFDVTVHVPRRQNLTNNQSLTNFALSANTGNTTDSGIDSRLYTVNVILSA